MTSVPPPAQTSIPLASIQSTAPMLQNPITMTKVSWKGVLMSSHILFAIILREREWDKFCPAKN